MTGHPSRTRGKREIGYWIMLWGSVVMMLLTPLVLFLYGLGSARRQHRIVTSHKPVRATILASSVTNFSGSKGTVHYIPKVKYQYHVADGFDDRQERS